MPQTPTSESDDEKPKLLQRVGQSLKRFLERNRQFTNRHPALKIFYKTFVAILGGLIILAGIAMLVLPGPGWLTIFFGMAVLGTEFVWPRKALSWLRKQLSTLKARFDNYRKYKREKKAQKLEEKNTLKK